MELKNLVLTIGNKKYHIEAEFFDLVRDEQMMIAFMQIKAPNKRYFTYEFDFADQFLADKQNKLSFMKDKALKITKKLLSEKAFQDKVIKISHEQEIINPQFPLKKHSAYYRKS